MQLDKALDTLAFLGRVKGCQLFLSNDGRSWGSPAAAGEPLDQEGAQRVMFAQPATARYLKFVATSEMRGNPRAAVAELDVVPAD